MTEQKDVFFACLAGLAAWAVVALAFFLASGCSALQTRADDPRARLAVCGSVCAAALAPTCPGERSALEGILGAAASTEECLAKCGEAYDLLYDGATVCRESVPATNPALK